VSDDIPLIFSDQLHAREGHVPRVVFLSAATAAQMLQYATAGWQVIAADGFQSTAAIDLAAVPAQRGEAHAEGADIVSVEAPAWTNDARAKIALWQPAVVKVNCAFHGIDDQRGEDIAATLAGLGYVLLAAHWRDDNTYGFGTLARIDHLGAYPSRDWKHLSLIAVRDGAHARTILTVARLYVGEERRIAELRLSNAIRGDHITRLEEALMVHQR
jgi:hypothetical protein